LRTFYLFSEFLIIKLLITRGGIVSGQKRMINV